MQKKKSNPSEGVNIHVIKINGSIKSNQKPSKSALSKMTDCSGTYRTGMLVGIYPNKSTSNSGNVNPLREAEAPCTKPRAMEMLFSPENTYRRKPYSSAQ